MICLAAVTVSMLEEQISDTILGGQVERGIGGMSGGCGSGSVNACGTNFR